MFDIDGETKVTSTERTELQKHRPVPSSGSLPRQRGTLPQERGKGYLS